MPPTKCRIHGNYAACQHEDGHYVFKIVGHPHSLETDLESGVEGCGHLPEGTIVCKGVHMNEVGRAPRWCTPPPGGNPKKHVFRVRHVVDPDLEMEDPSETVKLPPRRGNAQILQEGTKKSIN